MRPMPETDRPSLADLAAEVARLLVARGETLAVAETSAGGWIGAALTAISGSSTWFLGSAVAYSAAAKAAWLGWTAPADGIVSAAAAETLAEAARGGTCATWGLAETGIAGTAVSRRSAKPAGLTYVAVAGGTSGCTTRSAELRAPESNRVAQQEAFAVAALALLIEVLTG